MNCSVENLFKEFEGAPCEQREVQRVKKAIGGIKPRSQKSEKELASVARYLLGSKECFAVSREFGHEVPHLLRILSPYPQWTTIDKRILTVCVDKTHFVYQKPLERETCGSHFYVFSWIREQIQQEGDFELYPALFSELIQSGISENQILQYTFQYVSDVFVHNEQPSSVGKFVAFRAKQDLPLTFGQIKDGRKVAHLVAVLLRVDNKFFDEQLESFIDKASEVGAVDLARILLTNNAEKYEEPGRRLLKKGKKYVDQYFAGKILLSAFPEQREEPKRLVLENLARYHDKIKMGWDTALEMVDWLLQIYGEEVRQNIKRFIATLNDTKKSEAEKILHKHFPAKKPAIEPKMVQLVSNYAPPKNRRRVIDGDLRINEFVEYCEDLLVNGNLLLQWYDEINGELKGGDLTIQGNLEVKGTISAAHEGVEINVSGSLQTHHLCLAEGSKIRVEQEIGISGFSFLGTETELHAHKINAKAVFLWEEVELDVEEEEIEYEVQFWHDDFEESMSQLHEAVIPEFAAVVVDDDDIDPSRISDYLSKNGAVFHE